MIPYVTIGKQIIKFSKLGFKKRKRELKHIYKTKQAKIEKSPFYGKGKIKSEYPKSGYAGWAEKTKWLV